jgi:hypothetical protein
VVRGSIGDDGFAALCATKSLAKLRPLNVTANDISGEGLEALADNFPDLRNLVLTANPIGDDGIANLRAWKHLGQVETLYLSKCDLSAAGVNRLLATPMPGLKKLTLSGNELDDGVADALAKRAASLPALRHVELISTEISAKAATTLAKKVTSLARIDVRKNDIDTDDVAELGPRVRA